jgi:hypothetical protein
MSVMSKMRTPRRRSLLTVSIAVVPQSMRARRSSPEMKRRFRYTETSLCDAGQT